MTQTVLLNFNVGLVLFIILIFLRNILPNEIKLLGNNLSFEQVIKPYFFPILFNLLLITR